MHVDPTEGKTLEFCLENRDVQKWLTASFRGSSLALVGCLVGCGGFAKNWLLKGAIIFWIQTILLGVMDPIEWIEIDGSTNLVMCIYRLYIYYF